MVLAVEHDDLLTAGPDPRNPHDLGVGLRRRQSELPLGHPVPPRQRLGHDQRILAGQEELAPRRDPLADGTDDRRGGVPAEGAHVRDVHIHVLVAVKVPEPGPCPVRHPQRRMIVQLIHPRHRDATRHRPGGAGGRFHRTRAAVSEPFPLGDGKRLDLGLIHPGPPATLPRSSVAVWTPARLPSTTTLARVDLRFRGRVSRVDRGRLLCPAHARQALFPAVGCRRHALGRAVGHRSGTVSRSLLSVTAFTLARPHWRGQRVSVAANLLRRNRTRPVLTEPQSQACQERHHNGVLAGAGAVTACMFGSGAPGPAAVPGKPGIPAAAVPRPHPKGEASWPAPAARSQPGSTHNIPFRTLRLTAAESAVAEHIGGTGQAIPVTAGYDLRRAWCSAAPAEQ